MADKMSKLILPVKTGDVIAPKEFDVGGGGNTFVGTSAEWEALTTEQQNAYDCRVLTDDDLGTKSVIDNLTSDSATDALSAKQGKVLAQLVAPVLSTLVAPTGGLAIGDQFIYKGLLYKATAAIAEGGTIIINGNCELADSVTEQIDILSNNFSETNDNRPVTYRTRLQIETNFIPTTSNLITLFNAFDDEGLKGSVVVDFRKTGENIIRSSMFYSHINSYYGAGIIVSYYEQSFYKVINKNGIVTITPF